MKAKQIEELLVDDIEGGAIEVKSAEGYDFRFVLKKQLLMLSQGVVYSNERDELEIGFVIKRYGKANSERVVFKFDGKGVVSSIRSSALFATLVRETNTPNHFFSSNASFLKALDRCKCKDSREMNHRLIGFDLSFPEIARKRGGLIAVQCYDCEFWFLQPFHADTHNLKDSASLHNYIVKLFDESHVHVPPLSALNDAPVSQYKVYSPYTSTRQIEENRKKILELKER